MNPSPVSETLVVKLPSDYDDDIPPPLSDVPPDNLPCDDGEPMETPWHRAAMNLMIDVVGCHFRERDDFFVGGNMFVYYRHQQWSEELESTHFRGPDFFYVSGVERHRSRPYYAVWDEGGRYPNAIVELLSPTTEKIDRVDKRELYQNVFRTPEYFLCGAEVATLEGLRLTGGRGYEPILPNERGWLWSEQLQLWLGPWTGTYLGDTMTWLRVYDASGQLVLRDEERMAERAEQEKQRAEQEKQRADLAETEASRLRREVEELRQQLSQKPQ